MVEEVTMSYCPKNPLRPLLEEERRQLIDLSRCQAAPAGQVARAKAAARGWNTSLTPFVWGGKCAARRQRAWERRHRLGGSGAVTCPSLSSQVNV